jgi:hypothetical protein
MVVKRRCGKGFASLLILASKKKGRRSDPPAFILVGLTRFRAA